MTTNPFQNQSSTPSSIVGVFVPKAQTKDVLGEVKKEVESGYVTTKEGVQPVRTIQETQRGYTRNIVSRSPTQTQTKQVVENVASNINREVGGQQLVTYSPVVGGFKVTQNPNTVFNPNVNREISSNLIKAGLVGRSQDSGSVVFKPPVETGAVRVVLDKQDLSNVMSRVQKQPEQSYTAKVIYGEAGREVGSQAVNLYDTINPSEIKTTSAKILFERQKPYIEGERFVQKLETSPGIVENIAGGLGRMYLGASELFVNAPQTVGLTLGAEFERRAGVKPSVEDVKVIGTGLGLAAAGAAGTEQIGQNIALFDAFGTAGIARGAKIGAAIGLGTSTVAESSNVIEGKKADVGRVAIQTGLGAVGGAIGGAIETGIPKVTSAIGKTKIAQDIGKGIAEARIKGADININTQQFITPLTDTEGYNIGRGTFTSKSLGISGDIGSSARIKSISPFESAGIGEARLNYRVGGKTVKATQPFEFTQIASQGKDLSTVQGSFSAGKNEGIYTTALQQPSKVIEVNKPVYSVDFPPREFEKEFTLGITREPVRVKSPTDVGYVFERGIKETLPSDKPLLDIRLKGRDNIMKGVTGVFESTSKVERTEGGDVFKNIQTGLERARGQKLDTELSSVIKSGDQLIPVIPEKSSSDLFISTSKEQFKKVGTPTSVKSDVYFISPETPTDIIPVASKGKITKYVETETLLPKDIELVPPVDKQGNVRLRGGSAGGGRVKPSEFVNAIDSGVYDEFALPGKSKFVSPTSEISEGLIRSSLRENAELFVPKLNLPKVSGIGLGFVSGIKFKGAQLETSKQKQSLGDLMSFGQPTIPNIADNFIPKIDEPVPVKNDQPPKVEQGDTFISNFFNQTSRNDFSFSVNIGAPVSPFSISAPALGLPNLGSGGGGSEGARGQKVSARANVLDLLSITRLRR